MSARWSHLLLLSVMPLAGCAAANISGADPLPASRLTGNWQIQSGTAITSGPQGSIFLVGAMQQQGSTVTGTFTGSTICPTEQVFNLAGAVDVNGNLSLTAAPVPYISVQLAVPSAATTPATGNLSATGQMCALALQSPAIGVQIVSATGAFAGMVTAIPATPIAPVAVGNVSLSLTQSATANATGQFPLSGAITFTGGGCTATTTVTGTISGTGITLDSAAGAGSVTFAGTTNPSGSAITASTIQFTSIPCSSGSPASGSYAGTLAHQ